MYDKTKITHHGVLGQIWGVKNGPPYPIRPRAIANDPDAGETVAKGTTMYRISGKTNDQGQDTMYVTYKKYDRAYYKAAWGDVAKGNGGKVYEHEFTLNEDLKIPSLNERKRMLCDLVEEAGEACADGATVTEMCGFLNGNGFRCSLQDCKDAYYDGKPFKGISKEESDDFVKSAKEHWKGAFLEQLKEDPTGAASTLEYSSEAMKKYKEISLRNGYNVIYDDYACYTDGSKGYLVRMNDSALILLDPKNQVTQTNCHEVTKKETDMAIKEYCQWQNGKRKECYNTPLSLNYGGPYDFKKGAKK